MSSETKTTKLKSKQEELSSLGIYYNLVLLL